jgi:GDP-L-fucose synthase
LARENNTDFVVWGSGTPLREFIFSRDVARLTEWVLENYSEDEPIILSTSEELSIKEIVNTISELMNFRGKTVFDSSKPDGQFRKPSDNSKIKNYLPNFNFTSLYDGLKETIEYFEMNYQTIRK